MSIASLTSKVRELISQDDLAAAVVHVNDTYRIEEKWVDGQIDLPGMARFAGFVASLRSEIAEALGEDRTLVVHSGDFLSPSMMSVKLGSHGRQMVELMGLGGVGWTTLGNHEFDYEREGEPPRLPQSLRDAGFGLVGLNLSVPPAWRAGSVGMPPLEPVVLWPPRDPFLAVIGMVGEATAGVAARWGWEVTPWRDALERALPPLVSDKRIGCVVALTHMSRSEDQEFAAELESRWRNCGYAYVLGGHDHDVCWRERPAPTVSLSKNLLNCRSVTVVLLTKRLVSAAPRTWVSTREITLTAEQEKNSLRLHRPPLPRGDDAAISAVVDRAIETYRGRLGDYRRADFVAAHERHLRAVGSSVHYRDLIADDIAHAIGGGFIWDYARLELDGEFDDAGLFFILRARDFELVAPHREAEAKVEAWRARLDVALGGAGDTLVADFSAGAEALDATDATLRSRSSDFGNFVADAVRTGLEADVAVVHAGMFRSDELLLGGRVLLRDLQEAFIYDRPDAMVAIDVTSSELALLYEHALKRGGSGGFLQVSHSLGAFDGSENRRLRLALPKFLLEDDQDGYRSILLTARSWNRESLRATLATAQGASLIDLVQLNGRRVAYDRAIRLEVTKQVAEVEIWARSFIAYARTFAKLAVRRLGLAEPWDALWDRYTFLRSPAASAEWLSERLDATDHALVVGGTDWKKLKEARDRMYVRVFEDVISHPTYPDRIREISRRLRNGRETHEDGVDYCGYLNALLEGWRE